MKIRARILTILTFLLPRLIIAGAGEPDKKKWILSNRVLYPVEKGSFEEVPVKDPSIVSYGGRWHLFFTARSAKQYTISLATADKLTELESPPRHDLEMIRGKNQIPWGITDIFL